MAERPRFVERWWAKAAVAAGALAMTACGPGKPPGNYAPKDYNTFGQLECYKPDAPTLTSEIFFDDRAVKTFVVYAIMQANHPAESMRIKFFGPRSSVLATNQGGGEVDVDVGVLNYESTLVIDGVLPGVAVTAVMSNEAEKKLIVTAECL